MCKNGVIGVVRPLSLPNESTSGGLDIEKRKVDVLVCITYKSDFVKEKSTSRLNQVKNTSLPPSLTPGVARTERPRTRSFQTKILTITLA